MSSTGRGHVAREYPLGSSDRPRRATTRWPAARSHRLCRRRARRRRLSGFTSMRSSCRRDDDARRLMDTEPAICVRRRPERASSPCPRGGSASPSSTRRRFPRLIPPERISADLRGARRGHRAPRCYLSARVGTPRGAEPVGRRFCTRIRGSRRLAGAASPAAIVGAFEPSREECFSLSSSGSTWPSVAPRPGHRDPRAWCRKPISCAGAPVAPKAAWEGGGRVRVVRWPLRSHLTAMSRHIGAFS